MPTEPVKLVCYVDDLTVWATEVKIPDREVSINSYLEEITAYLLFNKHSGYLAENMLYVCVRSVIYAVFSVCIVTRGAVGAHVWEV